jgi:hypothetical protein
MSASPSERPRFRTPQTDWKARPLEGQTARPESGRWGVVHVPTGRWIAFGSERRCRAVAAQLAEIVAILRRPGPLRNPGGGRDGECLRRRARRPAHVTEGGGARAGRRQSARA